MDKNQELIKELNKFLKGCHMGGQAFRVYIEKSKNKGLKNQLTQIIESFKKHEEWATSNIVNLGGNPVDTVGFVGEIASLVEKIKDVFVDTDMEVINKSIEGIDMGIKGGQTLINEYKDKDLDKSILEGFKNIVEEYKHQKQKLENLKATL